MNLETTGKVISISKQWWLKINTKSIRKNLLDGALFPHIIKVEYIIDGKPYTKRKWISAGATIPKVGDFVTITHDKNKPSRAKVL